MAPPARRERAETSWGRKPRSKPIYLIASRSTDVMEDGVTCCIVAPLKTRLKGVVGGALALRRWMIRRAIAITGHRNGSPVRPSRMTSLGMPFFCVVKVSETDVDVWRSSASEASCKSNLLSPIES